MKKLRVYHVPQVGHDAILYIPVETPEEGKKVIDILACYDLFQFEKRIKPDYCNTSGLEQFNEETQEWELWELETEDDYFDDINKYFEDNEKMKEFSNALFDQLKR